MGWFHIVTNLEMTWLARLTDITRCCDLGCKLKAPLLLRFSHRQGFFILRRVTAAYPLSVSHPCSALYPPSDSNRSTHVGQRGVALQHAALVLARPVAVTFRLEPSQPPTLFLHQLPFFTQLMPSLRETNPPCSP